MAEVEDFEFKPITEGLGFHRKATTENLDEEISIDIPIRVEGPRNQRLTELIASLPPAYDFMENEKAALDKPKIIQPLGRTHNQPKPGAMAAPTVVKASAAATSATQAVVPTSNYRKKLEADLSKAFPHVTKAQPQVGLQAISTHFGAALIDGMAVFGLTTLCLISILTITGINLTGLLSNAATDLITKLHIVLLFFATLQIYILTARSFFGVTLGDWAFDLQLGSDEDQKSIWYPVLVIWRSLLMVLTLSITLPLLSLAIKKDIAKSLTGLQLYRK